MLIFTLAFPAPLLSGTVSDPNEMVLRRLNSPERAAASARMHEEYAKQQAELAASEGKEKPTSKAEKKPSAPPSGSLVAGSGMTDIQEKTSAGTLQDSAPRSATEVLFNQGASLVGLPGLAPREGVDGSRDEGRGFHQDGTVRKAEPDGKRRAPAHMRAAVPGQKNALGLYDDAARLEDLSSSGGKISGQSSREFDNLDPNELLLNRGLNYGSGIVNSWGESVLSGLVDGGRARLNYRLDSDGDVAGEGDALFPWYDGTYTTVFTQIGARSMTDDEKTRWIGNFGLGQRWFPFASGEIGSPDYDAGTMMVGYNAFFDYDFTRSHQRGGVGAELQYDWLRLSSNYYFPLSDWKGSYDFDSSLVEERPAEGWDARIKAYLPFYRNVALTGSYSRWYGDNVGVYGASDLEKNPRVWSYGIEYTPVPLVSGFLRQKSTEHGRTDTEFGLTFNYHFGMSLEEQTSPTKVAELRTVGGSRHEFVDRENKIILEYRAKNAFRIEYVGKAGTNRFNFRLVNGFDRTVSGQMVHASVTDATFPNGTDFATFITGGNGEFTLALDTVTATPVPATIQAGETTGNFNLDAELTALDMKASPNTLTQHKAQSVTFTVTRKDGSPMSGASVAFDSSAAFTGLSGTYTTDGSGNFTVPGLTAVLSGEQSLSAKVNGKTTAKTQFTVTAATYVLTADKTALNQHEQHDVTFTLTRNSETVPGLSVLFTKGEGFASLPADAQATDASGQFKVTGLTPILSGQQEVEVSINNEGTAKKAFNVTAATYNLTATPDTLVRYEGQNVTFKLTTANGAAVPNVSVTFTANSSFNNLPTTVQTNTGGEFTVSGLMALTAGSQSVEVTVDGQKVNATLTVNEATYNLTATPDTLVRYEGQNVTFKLTTSGGAAVPNTSVTFTANANFNSLPQSTQTNAGGEFTVSGLTALTAGSQSVEVTVNGQKVNATLAVNEATYNLTATPDTLVRYEGQNVTFKLTTSGGAAVPNKSVAFTGNSALELSTSTETTNANGEITIPNLRSMDLQPKTVQASVDGQTLSVQLTVSQGGFNLEANPTALLQHEQQNVTFTIKTDNGTPIPNASVTFANTTNFTGLPGTTTTDANGQIRDVSLTAIESGTQTVQVTMDGQTESVEFAVTPATYQLSTSDTLQQWEVAKSVTFTLMTGNNTPVPDAKVSYTISNLGGADIANTTQTGNDGTFTVNGVATKLSTAANVTVTVDGKQATTTITVTSASYSLTTTDKLEQREDARPLTFTLKTSPNNTPVRDADVSYTISGLGGANVTGTARTNTDGTFTTDPVATTLETVAVVDVIVDNERVSGTIDVTRAVYELTTSDRLEQWEGEKPLTFTLKTYPKGTPIKNADVSYTISGLGGANVTDTTRTDANGTFTIKPVATTLGTQATAEVLVDGKQAQAFISVTGATYGLYADPASLTRYEPTDVTFTLKTTKGTPVPGVSVSFTANDKLGLSSQTQTTDASGQIQNVSLTAIENGQQTVAVTVDGQTPSVDFTVSQGGFKLEANPSSLLQHEQQNVTFTLKTTKGTPVPNVSVTFVANADLGLTAVTKTTDGSGQIQDVSLTPVKDGQQTVTFTVDGQTETSSITVTSATYDLSVSPQTLIQHVGTDVTFTIKRNNKTVSGLAVTFAANPDLGLSAGTRNTDASGQITLNLTPTATGAQTVQVTVDGKTLTTQLQVDPPSYSLETSDSLSQYDSGDVTFTVKRNGQIVSGLSVVFTANADLGLSAVTKTTNSSGQVTVTGLKSATAGQKTVEVTVDRLGKADTKLTVAEASFILTTVSQTLTRHEPGGSAEFRITTQAKGSPVPDTQVSIAANSVLGMSSAANLRTDSDGKFTLGNLTPTLSGAQTVTATVNNKSVQGSVTVAKAQYQLAITSSTNPIQHEPNQTVTFKLTTTNGHPASNVQVTFASNSNISGLTGPYTTQADGSFTVSTLTVKARTAQQVSVNVDTNEGSANTRLNVTPAQYKLSTSDTLIQYEPGNVTFTLVTSYDTKVPGLKATFTNNSNFNLPTDTQTTGANGQFTATLTATGSGDLPIAVTVDDGGTADMSLHVKEVTLGITNVTGGGEFVSGKSTTATFTAQMLADGEPYTYTSTPSQVTWNLGTVDNSPNKAVMDSHKTKKTGLAWGTNAPGSSAGDELTSSTTSTLSGSTGAQIQLTDIMGQRKVTMEAEVSMYGQKFSGTKEFTFGAGPLSVFAGVPKGTMTWLDAVSACGGTGDLNTAGYQRSTNLPTEEQLKAVSSTGNYAYLAAGWPDDGNGFGWFCYWTGEADGYGSDARGVDLDRGYDSWDYAAFDYPVAVCLP